MLKIHHFLSQFQNGFRLGKPTLEIDFNKTFLQLCQFFLDQGLIHTYLVQNQKILLTYKYTWDGKSMIQSFTILSKKRVRQYTKKPKEFGEKHFLTVISTSKGLMTKDQCFLHGVGGEEWFEIRF